MKNQLKLIICAAVLLAVSAPSALAQGKVGVVDIRVLFEGYFKTKQADARIKQRAAELDEEREEMLISLRADEEAYRTAEEMAKDLSASPAEVEERKAKAAILLNQLQDKKQSFSSWERSAQEIIAEQQNRLRARVLEEINTEISAVAKQEGMFLVINKDAMDLNQTKIISYHNGDHDITQKVLSNLNAGAPAGLASPTNLPSALPTTAD